MPTFLSPQQVGFTIGQVTLNLCLAFALAFLAASVYHRLHAGPSAPFSFFVSLVVVPMVVCMIMMAIGSNVALSLGLVGALSIIRFRAVIKDTRDMSVLFLMIGIGLCCGSGAYALAIFGTASVCAVLALLQVAMRARYASSEYILVFRRHGQDDGTPQRALEELTPWRKLHGVADLGGDEGCEYTYRVRLGKLITPEALLDRLRAVKGLSGTSLISPESQLAL